MGLTGMVFSAISVAVGAVMYWAITTQGHGFRLTTVGVILMLVGAAGFVVSSVVFGISKMGVSKSSTFDRQVTDSQGQSATVHEEVH